MSKITSMSALAVGDQVPPLQVTIEREALIRYAGASDDYAYPHWDRTRMIELGSPDVVVHGWLTFAHMCRAVTDWIPRELAEVESYEVRYRRPTFPGRIECGGEVARLAEDGRRVDLKLWAKDAHGEITTTASLTLNFGV